MLLYCKDLTKKFGEITAVNRLSFDVKAQEIFGIAGPNGAGKTTLYNLITGVYKGIGEINFDGSEINNLDPHRICHKGIARTFQIPQLATSLSAYHNIKIAAHFGNEKNRVDKKVIDDVIAFNGLRDKQGIVADKLSLIDKKLTMVAAAMATQPKMLMFDEPMAGLSPLEIRHLMDLFKKINEERGLTIVIIEHFMKVLTELADRLMILENGAKLCIGPPLEVTQDKRVIESYLGNCYAESK
ncbi:MAG: ATP-binding cassette domain-containing protein [Desulfobacterales bacterium]|nr:ATP-binding cassette domain-containing protein [Desulfobacterales bacterium]